MSRFYKILLSVLSGLLLAFGWPERGFPILLFVGFVPILLVENEQWKKKRENGPFGIFGYSFIAFMVWNILTTYWLYNSTLAGVIAAVLLNTVLMSVAFNLFHITRRNMKGQSITYIAFIGYWLSLEFLQLRWDLNWPWLNLGNGFAAYPKWIQWYEYTGIFGGSLWILAVNILLFRFFQARFIQKICSRQVGLTLFLAIILLVLPILVSNVMYFKYNEKIAPIDVVVVQPNLNPYKEQYSLDPQVVNERMLSLALQKTDSLTQFIVFPESALQEGVWEDQTDESKSIKRIRAFNRSFSNMAAVVGISTRKIFIAGEPLSPTARKFSDTNCYYDAYNTALFIAHDGRLGKYHKSKLTPGVERMPYPKTFHFLEKYALNLGGTVGSLGIDPEQIPFRVNDSLKIASVICYESAFGEFLNRFIRNGANVVFVITNDGWWGNTPGHRQHLLFSVLRAIETRRSIARSANTGISCFINQRGDISKRTAYWVPTSIRAKINTNTGLTFYVKYGDYIGRIFLLMAGLMALFTISFSIRKRNHFLK